MSENNKNLMGAIAGLSSLAQLASTVSGSSPLCVNRTKIDTDELTTNNVLTLRDFDYIEYHDDVEDNDVSYPVCIFDELPSNFYCGGAQLDNLCKAIINGGLYEELKSTGLKLQFVKVKTRSGNTFVNFSVVG